MSDRPSPDMSARKIDCVLSAKTIAGPLSSSVSSLGTRLGGPKPNSASDG